MGQNTVVLFHLIGGHLPRRNTTNQIQKHMCGNASYTAIVVRRNLLRVSCLVVV